MSVCYRATTRLVGWAGGQLILAVSLPMTFITIRQKVFRELYVIDR